MAAQIGQPLPNATFKTFINGEAREMTTSEIFSNHDAVLVAVPGAFTPTCSNSHVPDFIRKSPEILNNDITRIVVVSVNDHYVMNAWAKDLKAPAEILFLADPDANFTNAVGLQVDLSEHGLGVRSKRYSMIVNNGKIDALNIEPGTSEVTISSADKILDDLRAERSSTPTPQPSSPCCSEHGE